MRTTVDLPEYLIEDVIRLTGASTKRDALIVALEDFVRRKAEEMLLEAPGTIDIEYVRPDMEDAESEFVYSISETPRVGLRVAESPERYH